MNVRQLCAGWVLAISCAVAASPQASNSQLEPVLVSMDKAASSFKTVECTFQWDQFTKVVNDTDRQNGTIYFRRTGNGVEMAAHIEKPDAKIVVFSDGLVRIYQPKIDTEQQFNASKNRQQFESFLVLGFGGRGHDLDKNFDVQYGGNEQVDGVNTAKLMLTPKDPGVKNMFNSIILWIDPARGISIQQKFLQPSGDYRLAKYSDVKTNQKLPDNAFKIPSTRKTKVERPNG
jgi:outer membrane lipoprotein-sorting protein